MGTITSKLLEGRALDMLLLGLTAAWITGGNTKP
jgi:hypothetical protein